MITTWTMKVIEYSLNPQEAPILSRLQLHAANQSQLAKNLGLRLRPDKFVNEGRMELDIR